MAANKSFEGFKTIEFWVLCEKYTKCHLAFKETCETFTIPSWKALWSCHKNLRVLTPCKHLLLPMLFDFCSMLLDPLLWMSDDGGAEALSPQNHPVF